MKVVKPALSFESASVSTVATSPGLTACHSRNRLLKGSDSVAVGSLALKVLRVHRLNALAGGGFSRLASITAGVGPGGPPWSSESFQRGWADRRNCIIM